MLTAAEMAEHAFPFQLQGAENQHSPAHSAPATDQVRLVGDAVAVVVADSRAEAEDACELVEVDYEELPPVATIDQALDPSSTPLWDDLGHNLARRTRTRSTATPTPRSPRRRGSCVSASCMSRQSQVPMETRGAVAALRAGADRRLTYHGAMQGTHMVRFALAAMLQLPVHQVRAVNGDIGGSFGQKSSLRSEDLAICVASSSSTAP